MKYSLSTREIPRAEPEGSEYISLYIIIQRYSFFPGRAILEGLILRIGLAVLGNTRGQESKTRRVKFKYYPF